LNVTEEVEGEAEQAAAGRDGFSTSFADIESDESPTDITADPDKRNGHLSVRLGSIERKHEEKTEERTKERGRGL